MFSFFVPSAEDTLGKDDGAFQGAPSSESHRMEGATRYTMGDLRKTLFFGIVPTSHWAAGCVPSPRRAGLIHKEQMLCAGAPHTSRA